MRATQPRPYGCASVPRTGEPIATVRLERPWTVASVSPTSTRSTAQYSISGVYQRTSPRGAVTPMVAMPSSILAQTWRPGRYWRSEGRAKRADGAVETTEISDTNREPDASPGRKLRRCGSSDLDDPPGGVGRPVHRQRPALREGSGAVLRSTHHGGGVAVLHVAAAAELHIDGRRRGQLIHLHSRDPDPLHARPAHHEARLPGCVTAVQQPADGLGRRDPLERGILPVHRLGPRADRSPGSRLEDVRREAGVGEREVQRVRPRVTLEVELGQVRRGEALGKAVRHRELGERLVIQTLLVRPRGGHDLVVQVVVALRA